MNWLSWALLSAFFAGLTAVFAKAGVTHIDSNLATAIRTFVVLMVSWAFAAATHRSGALAEIGGRALGFLVLSGLATGLSWLCYFRALQLGDASRVAPVDKLGVVFVLMLAAVFLKERITLQTCVGTLLIVMGAAVVAWRK